MVIMSRLLFHLDCLLPFNQTRQPFSLSRQLHQAKSPLHFAFVAHHSLSSQSFLSIQPSFQNWQTLKHFWKITDFFHFCWRIALPGATQCCVQIKLWPNPPFATGNQTPNWIFQPALLNFLQPDTKHQIEFFNRLYSIWHPVMSICMFGVVTHLFGTNSRIWDSQCWLSQHSHFRQTSDIRKILK